MGNKTSQFQPDHLGRLTPDSNPIRSLNRSHASAAEVPARHGNKPNIARDASRGKAAFDLKIHGGMTTQSKSGGAAFGGDHKSAIDFAERSSCRAGQADECARMGQRWRTLRSSAGQAAASKRFEAGAFGARPTKPHHGRPRPRHGRRRHVCEPRTRQGQICRSRCARQGDHRRGTERGRRRSPRETWEVIMAWSDEARAAAAAARAAAAHPAHSRAVFTLPPKSPMTLAKFAGNVGRAALGVAAGAAGTFIRSALRNQGGRRR